MHQHGDPDWDPIRAHLSERMKALFNIDDSSGVELFVMLQRVAHLTRMLDIQPGEDAELSAPRWRLLLRLFMEEDRGGTAGLTPTMLSRSQRVSKNTISALLRGLETQGLIQRILDTGDLRTFRIQLTDAGRDYLRSSTPRRIESLNRLLSVLNRQEQSELTVLLEKLQHALLAQCHQHIGNPDSTTGTLHQEFSLQ